MLFVLINGKFPDYSDIDHVTNTLFSHYNNYIIYWREKSHVFVGTFSEYVMIQMNLRLVVGLSGCTFFRLSYFLVLFNLCPVNLRLIDTSGRSLWRRNEGHRLQIVILTWLFNAPMMKRKVFIVIYLPMYKDESNVYIDFKLKIGFPL